MIAALALLAPLPLCAQEPTAHGPEPGPRAAVAGLAGFQSVSRLDFGTGQNRLTAVYVFPDRVRWHFESYAGGAGADQQFLYRNGERVHQLAGGESQEIEGEQRDVALLQMELRRAVMLWPDGFAWAEPKDGARTASVHADSCCRERPIGTLVATPAEGRPQRIEVRTAAGETVEALEIRAWQELQGRAWPKSLVLDSGGGGFVETIESIQTRVHFLDLSFLPPDRRALPASASEPGLVAQDLVPITYAVRALPAGIGWDDALARARAWIAEERAKPSGLAIDPVPTFELSGDGRPVSCLLRLSTALVPAPADYQTVPERPGFLLALPKLDDVGASTLNRLRKALPPGAVPGPAYLRVHPRQDVPIEVVLPMNPPD